MSVACGVFIMGITLKDIIKVIGLISDLSLRNGNLVAKKPLRQCSSFFFFCIFKKPHFSINGHLATVRLLMGM